MKNFYLQNKIILDKIIFLVSFIVGFYIFAVHLFTYVSPFVFGYILSVIIRPMVFILSKKMMLGRTVGTVGAIIILLSTLGLLLIMGVTRLLQEGAGFLDSLPYIVIDIQHTIDDFSSLFEGIYQMMPQVARDWVNSVMDGFRNTATVMAEDGVRNFTTEVIPLIPQAVFGIILGLISCFFFSRDKEYISDSLQKYIPMPFVEKFRIVRSSVVKALGGYFKAQFMIAGIVTSIGTAGLFIIGVPYPLFISVIIGLVDMIPVFGSGLFYWPWIIYNVIIGNYSMAISLGIIYAILLLTRQILEPKIVGKQIGIYPLLTLMSVYIGFRVFGFIGLFAGPCIAVIIKTFLKNSKEEQE